MTQDPETGYAYIYLEEPSPGMIDDSVSLEAIEGYEAFRSIVLDLGADGRLVGIEILGDARKVLRPAALATAVEPGFHRSITPRQQRRRRALPLPRWMRRDVP